MEFCIECVGIWWYATLFLVVLAILGFISSLRHGEPLNMIVSSIMGIAFVFIAIGSAEKRNFYYSAIELNSKLLAQPPLISSCMFEELGLDTIEIDSSLEIKKADYESSLKACEDKHIAEQLSSYKHNP